MKLKSFNYLLGLLIIFSFTILKSEEEIDIWKNNKEKKTLIENKKLINKETQKLNLESIKTIKLNNNVKIENETFNTLKNQGYNFEHNYGHGKKNLCTVMSMLLLLTFFVDQVQLLCCKKYIQAKNKRSRFSVLFETVRSYFSLFLWESWDELYTRVGWNHNEMDRTPPMKMMF